MNKKMDIQVLESSFVNFIPIDKDTNPNDWYFQEKTGQFSPDIQLGDVVYINKHFTEIEDGKTYLLFHKEKEDEYLIRKLTHTLENTLKIKTPNHEEEVTEKELFQKYFIFGKVEKSVRMVVKEF